MIGNTDNLLTTIISNTAAKHFIFKINKTGHLHNNIVVNYLNIHVLSLMGEKPVDLDVAERGIIHTTS